jgi:hypothetical protein
VVSELIQSIGRARPFLDNGIPCFLASTENLVPLNKGIDGLGGFPIADSPFSPLTEVQWRLLNVLGHQRMRTGDLKAILGVSERRVREVLGELMAAGRVVKDGKTRGTVWKRSPYSEPSPT